MNSLRYATPYSPPRRERLELDPLTRRQLQCLHWAAAGKSSTDIGAILGLSARTVDDHLAAACSRLNVRTRVQAVVRALSLQLIPQAMP